VAMATKEIWFGTVPVREVSLLTTFLGRASHSAKERSWLEGFQRSWVHALKPKEEVFPKSFRSGRKPYGGRSICDLRGHIRLTGPIGRGRCFSPTGVGGIQSSPLPSARSEWDNAPWPARR
jgi:hypothetical protein